MWMQRQVDTICRQRFLQDGFVEIVYEIQNNTGVSLKEAFEDT
jgi:hypothetical protein